MAARAPDRVVTVTVDIGPVSRATLADTAAKGAYKSLLVRLVSEGLAFVDPTSTAEMTVTLSGGEDGATLHVAVATPAGTLEQRVTLSPADPEQSQLEIVHAVVDLVRRARSEAAAAPPPRASSPGWRVGASAETAILWSGHDVGAVASVFGSTPIGPLALVGGVAGHRPLGLPAELDMLEWLVYAGVHGRMVMTPRLVAEAGLDVGFDQQRGRYAAPGSTTEHTSLADLAASARLGLGVELTPTWRLSVRAGAWLTHRAHEYRTATTRLWRAPQARPFIAIGCDYEP